METFEEFSPSETILTEVLKKIVNTLDVNTRWQLACMTHQHFEGNSWDILDLMSKDPDPNVRLAVAKNESAGVHTLMALMEDEDEKVAKEASGNIALWD